MKLLLAVLIFTALVAPASAQEIGEPVNLPPCNRVTVRWDWYVESSDFPGLGYVADVAWTVPQGATECAVSYSIHGGSLALASAVGLQCLSYAPSTLTCQGAITSLAHAEFRARKVSGPVSDTDGLWFYWSNRVLLPIVATQ